MLSEFAGASGALGSSLLRSVHRRKAPPGPCVLTYHELKMTCEHVFTNSSEKCVAPTPPMCGIDPMT